MVWKLSRTMAMAAATAKRNEKALWRRKRRRKRKRKRSARPLLNVRRRNLKKKKVATGKYARKSGKIHHQRMAMITMGVRQCLLAVSSRNCHHCLVLLVVKPPTRRNLDLYRWRLP